jgi:hypothetical protein
MTDALTEEFFRLHPEHIVGFRSIEVNGKSESYMDPETVRAFTRWAMDRNGVPKDVQGQRMAILEGIISLGGVA